MTLYSMTGFARHAFSHEAYNFVWEIRSVNGKGLDQRFRFPQGLEAVEIPARSLVSQYIKRGNLQLSLSMSVKKDEGQLAINTALLHKLLNMSQDMQQKYGLAPSTLEGMLHVHGVCEARETSHDLVDMDAMHEFILAELETTLKALVDMRAREGAALKTVIEKQIHEIASLRQMATNDTARQPDVIFEKLRSQLAVLIEQNATLDGQRLYAEAAILASRADIEEELDRLQAHVVAAQNLIDQGGAIGRKMDFLCQEFNRETNTICAKSNATSLTKIGLDLKSVIEQLREQVQNLE